MNLFENKTLILLLKKLFLFFFSTLFLYAFIFGGTAQMTLNLSSTIVNFSVTICCLIVFIFYYGKKMRIEVDNSLLIGTITLTYIGFTSLYNETSIINFIFYNLIILLPICVKYLMKIGDKTGLISLSKTQKKLLIITLLQFIFVFVQLKGFDFLSKFNHSGQRLLREDFDFGSLLFKNDHALGFLLICNVLYVAFSNLFQRKYKIIIILCLSIIVLMLHSKATFGFLLLTYIYILTKIKLTKPFLILSIFVISLGAGFFALISVIEKPNYYQSIEKGLKIKYNHKSALKFFDLTEARRDQIINKWLHEDINWIGDGPYSYFDLEKGKFSETYIHFSQWLWSYKDLGLLGSVLLFFFIVSYLNSDKEKHTHYSKYIGFIFLTYGIFTVTLIDLNFLLIYHIYKTKID